MKRALLVLALAACDSALDRRLAIVDEPRVLAVVAEPAEAKPGASVTYRALVASPDGTVAAAPHWSYCTTPKPPTEDNAVSVPCIAGTDVVDLGAAETVTATLPADGCTRFGPDTPPGQGDFRPRDADPTGGYYQPIRAELDIADLAIGMSRITCTLPNASPEHTRRYMLEYVANANPTLEIDLPASVPANSEVTLSAAWPAASVESYLYYDRLAQQLIDRRESMRVSWFATGGAIAVDASAVAEDDRATSVSTTWRTPGPGTATLWFVLRDSRGGIATATHTLTIE